MTNEVEKSLVKVLLIHYCVRILVHTFGVLAYKTMKN